MGRVSFSFSNINNSSFSRPTARKKNKNRNKDLCTRSILEEIFAVPSFFKFFSGTNWFFQSNCFRTVSKVFPKQFFLSKNFENVTMTHSSPTESAELNLSSMESLFGLGSPKPGPYKKTKDEEQTSQKKMHRKGVLGSLRLLKFGADAGSLDRGDVTF